MALQVKIRGQAEPEPVMELYLMLSEEGSAALRGIDRDGHDWLIAWIGPDGIELAPSIPVNTGWPLDRRGTLHLVTE